MLNTLKIHKHLRLAIIAVSFAGLPAVFSYAADAPAAPAAAPAEAPQTAVPVKAVVLFSSGVGYFEHDGKVNGNASTELRFKTNQINDILKSLVLQDMDGGKVSTIVYPSQDPVDRLLKSFQVDITSNPTLSQLLNQLRGAKVKISAGTENLEGVVLGVEKKTKVTDKGSAEYWVLNLLTGAVIRSISLDDVTKLELQDAKLQEELTKALMALASARDQDKKPVTINFTGQGDRTVRLGYVVETPIWKTSYRLVLGNGPNAKPMLQGWAIVENQTDNDWTDVQLSLVSGRPISFIEELYAPLYIPRPVVQPELFASLRPQTYEGGLQEREKLQLAQLQTPAAGAPRNAASTAGGRGGGGGGVGGAGGFGAGEARDEKGDSSSGFLTATATRAGDRAPLSPASASIASVATAAKVGELFQYTVGSVSLPRQRSAMIPIITDAIEVEKLSIYNSSVLAKNPLNGARVKNTTGKHLLQGPVTVFEGSSYAGDAKVDNVPPGQERLLSYGIDLQMVMNSVNSKTDNKLLTGKIVKGVLTLQRKYVSTVVYQAENKAEAEKTLIIEHPLRHGWKLVTPEKPNETTDAVYRFRTVVPAGKAGTFTVEEQLVQDENFQLLTWDVGSIELYARTGEIPAKVRDALTKAAKGQNLTDIQRQMNEAQAQKNAIRTDQTPIRENLRSAPANSPLQVRLLTKLEEQETQVEKLDATVEQKRKDLDNVRKELENYLNELEVG